MCRRRMRTQSEWKVEISGCLGSFFPKMHGGPLLHFLGRLVGEGNRENAIGRDAMANQLGDAESDHPSLARAGPRQDQQRSGKRLDGFFLRRVEVHGMDRKAGIVRGEGGAIRSTEFIPWKRVFCGKRNKFRSTRPVLTPLAWRRYTDESIVEPTRTPV